MSTKCETIDEHMLERYLLGRLPIQMSRAVRNHLNICRACWGKWNNFRWDRAKRGPTYEELQEYLGASFQEYMDASWALADEWNRTKPRTQEEIEAFYRHTPYYLYNLMVWQDSGGRPPYVEYAAPYLRKYGSQAILDFGCGIGNDGLQLLEMGFDVTFCDLAGPSTQFLRWRLERRGMPAVILEPSMASMAEGWDTVWAMDVIEHLPDPLRSLRPLLTRAKLFVYDTHFDGTSRGRQPFHLHHRASVIKGLTSGFRRDATARHIKVWYRAERPYSTRFAKEETHAMTATIVG